MKTVVGKKIRCRKACRFDSGRGYKKKVSNIVASFLKGAYIYKTTTADDSAIENSMLYIQEHISWPGIEVNSSTGYIVCDFMNKDRAFTPASPPGIS